MGNKNGLLVPNSTSDQVQWGWKWVVMPQHAVGMVLHERRWSPHGERQESCTATGLAGDTLPLCCQRRAIQMLCMCVAKLLLVSRLSFFWEGRLLQVDTFTAKRYSLHRKAVLYVFVTTSLSLESSGH